MTKNVIITVRGLQPEVNAEEPIEIISTGTYHRRNDTHYLMYEEADEDGRLTKNRIKITKDALEMVKQGGTATQMFFARGEKQYSCYQTPFGEMMLGMTTNHFSVEESKEQLSAKLIYGLEINGEHISECELDIEVKSCETVQ